MKLNGGGPENDADSDRPRHGFASAPKAHVTSNRLTNDIHGDDDDDRIDAHSCFCML
jgi:hypothetical protein